MHLEDQAGIYSITNTVNGKQYFGSSKHLATRFKEHRRQLQGNRHHSPILQHAWNKYGSEAFVFDVRLVCTTDMLITYEQNFFDVYKPFYNCAPAAGSNLGYKHGEETRANMVVAARLRLEKTGGVGPRRGHKNTPEHNAKTAAAKTGKKTGPCSEERKKKIGDAHRGRKRAPETIEKMRAAATGRVASEETRAKLSAIHKGRKYGPEFGAQISARQLGKSMPEGHSENAGRAKATLTDDQVRLIRAGRAQGKTCRALALEYGINEGSMSLITRGLSYKWVK